MKKHLWAIGFSLFLTVFTTYAALDTFVIQDVIQTNATETDTSMITSRDPVLSAPETGTAEQSRGSLRRGGKGSAGSPGQNRNSRTSAADTPVTLNDAEEIGSYRDGNILITLTEYTSNNTKIYVADVRLSSVEYLKTAFAQDAYGKNITEKTSVISKEHQAILAVNGDYYGSREDGYVIRNGIVYRDTAGDAQVLCIYGDGSFGIIDPAGISAEELRESGVWQAFSFGPALIEDGEIAVRTGDEVGKSKASNPRTAIGIIDDLHYVFVVSDGRTDESEGLSLTELASFMDSLGVQTAYNLDGGGSSAMVFRGQVINKPTTNGSIRERGVSDIVYIG